MRKFQKPVAYLMLASMGILMSSCFGRFELVRKVYTWNDEVVQSRFVKTLLFYVMNFIPVYGIAGAVDFFILNLIEFWSGSNPLAMNDGDMEEEFYTKNGTQYHMVATKNQFTVTALDGPTAGQVQVLRFSEEELTWHFESDELNFAMLTFEGEDMNRIKAFSPEGFASTYVLNQEATDMASLYAPLPEVYALSGK